MEAIILKPIRIKSTGEEFFPGAVVDSEREKIEAWAARGLPIRGQDVAYNEGILS